MKKKEIEKLIRLLFEEWVREKNSEQLDKVRYAGPVIGNKEYQGILDALFNDWWSGGKFTVEAEMKLAKFSQRNYGLLTNSGSSANLVMMSAAKELYFSDNDKILTLACGFPTTVNPIIQSGMKPVFIDIDLETLNVNVDNVKEALRNDDNIKGIFVPHTLGFYGDIDKLLDVAREYDVNVFFDCCDAYGTKYKGIPIQQYGKAASFSFYVAHHLTMGEGGGVVTNDDELQIAMKGFRNWGRYCSSPNCCTRSINPESFCPSTKLTKKNSLPEDYTVNYIFEWMGYNLKPLDLQSAMLISQIDKAEEFDQIRVENYEYLKHYFEYHKYNFKTWELQDGVSPFAFPLMIPEDAPFTRSHFINYLKMHKIESRLLFAGNLTKHPAYQKKDHMWEVTGSLENSDKIMNRFLMLGVSQVNTEDDMISIKNTLNEFFKQW